MSRTLRMLAAALLAAACAGEPPAGGTLIVAAPGDADVLLPPVANTQLAAHVTEQLFPKLAQLTPSLNVLDDSGYVPVLARRWTRRDSLTLVFELDPRAHWQDGTPLTADDVVFSFDVYRDTLTASSYAPLLAPIASLTREDEHTVVARFHRAYAEQLYDATYHLRVMPRHLLDTIPRDRLASSAFARAPVGAGPFRFVSWREGAEIELAADSAWFLGRPTLDRIVWRILPDVTAAVTALLAGEANAIEVIPQRDELERARADAGVRLQPYPSPFLMGLLFNVRRPPLDDPAVRRALAMAVDRATIVQNIFGEWGEVPVGATSRMQWIAQGEVAQLPFDTAAAGRTLDSLGWRDGNGDGVRERGGRPLRLQLLAPTTSRIRQQAAVLLQDQLRRIGVDVRIQPLEFAVFDRRTRAGEFDVMMFSWTLDPSPGILAQFWRSGAPDNLAGYASPAFDSLYAAAAAARTRAEGLPAWHAVLEHLNRDAPGVFLMSPRNHAAFSTRVEHVTLRPDSWLATAASWRVAPEPAGR